MSTINSHTWRNYEIVAEKASRTKGGISLIGLILLSLQGHKGREKIATVSCFDSIKVCIGILSVLQIDRQDKHHPNQVWEDYAVDKQYLALSGVYPISLRVLELPQFLLLVSASTWGNLLHTLKQHKICCSLIQITYWRVKQSFCHFSK